MQKPIFIVLSGSVGAQLITLVSMTYAARHIGPEAFGLYAVVFAFASPIALLATLRLETTFIFRDDGQKVATTGFTALASLATITAPILSYGALTEREDITYVALLAFFLGANATVINLSNYRRKFWALSAVRLLVAFTTLFAVIAFVVMQLRDALTLAAICGQALGLLVGLTLHAGWIRQNHRRPSFNNMKAVFRENRAFSIFNGLQSLFSALQESSIVMGITSFLGVEAAGLYSLAQRILYAPISVVSEAIGRVFQVQIRASKDVDARSRRNYFDRLLLLLILGACLIAFLAYFVAAPVLVWVLGSYWQILHALLPAMSLYIAALFVAATVAIFPLALGQPRALSFLGVFGTSLYVLCVLAALSLGASLSIAFWVVSTIMPIYFIFFVTKVRKIVLS